MLRAPRMFTIGKSRITLAKVWQAEYTSTRSNHRTARKMGSSLSFNNRIRIVLAGVLSLQPFSAALSSEMPRPFPVLGSVSVQGSRWNDVPALLDRLADKVVEDSIRFQITASEAEQYFSLG